MKNMTRRKCYVDDVWKLPVQYCVSVWKILLRKSSISFSKFLLLFSLFNIECERLRCTFAITLDVHWKGSGNHSHLHSHVWKADIWIQIFKLWLPGLQINGGYETITNSTKSISDASCHVEKKEKIKRIDLLCNFIFLSFIELRRI